MSKTFIQQLEDCRQELLNLSFKEPVDYDLWVDQCFNIIKRILRLRKLINIKYND